MDQADYRENDYALDEAILAADQEILIGEMALEDVDALNEVICSLHEHKEYVGRTLNGEVYPPFPS